MSFFLFSPFSEKRKGKKFENDFVKKEKGREGKDI
jgi:hypothetical protein